MPDEKRERPYTTQQLSQFLRDNGYPVSSNQLNKRRSEGTGPKPFGKFGRNYLYSPSTALEWARSRIKPIPTEAAE